MIGGVLVNYFGKNNFSSVPLRKKKGFFSHPRIQLLVESGTLHK